MLTFTVFINHLENGMEHTLRTFTVDIKLGMGMIDKLDVRTDIQRHKRLEKQTDGDLLKFNKGAEPCTWKGSVSYDRYTGDWLQSFLAKQNLRSWVNKMLNKSQHDCLCSHESSAQPVHSQFQLGMV